MGALRGGLFPESASKGMCEAPATQECSGPRTTIRWVQGRAHPPTHTLTHAHKYVRVLTCTLFPTKRGGLSTLEIRPDRHHKPGFRAIGISEDRDAEGRRFCSWQRERTGCPQSGVRLRILSGSLGGVQRRRRVSRGARLPGVPEEGIQGPWRRGLGIQACGSQSHSQAPEAGRPRPAGAPRKAWAPPWSFTCSFTSSLTGGHSGPGAGRGVCTKPQEAGVCPGTQSCLLTAHPKLVGARPCHGG